MRAVPRGKITKTAVAEAPMAVAAGVRKITDYEHFAKLSMLNEQYEHFQPTALKVPLYEHQQVVVAGLIGLEATRKYTGKDVIGSSAIRLAEPLGSGKTIEIIALIAHVPIPKAFPLINSAPAHPTASARNRRGYMSSYHPTITTTYDTKGTFIPLSMVVVGVTVLKQWHRSFEEFSHLRAFEVGDYHSLRKLKHMLDTRTYGAYQVVVVKNGMVSGNDLGVEGKDLHSILTVLGVYLQDKILARVVYDDFDVIAIPSDARALNALSTIYVSATDKASQRHQQVDRFRSCDELLKQRVLLSNVFGDNRLSRSWAVKCHPAFVDACLKLPICEIYTYTFVNPDDRLIGLAGKFGEEGAQIVEMLNGDAVGEAAKALGIATTSVADIFERLLDKQYKTYLRAKTVVDACNATIAVIKKLDAHPKGKQAKMAKLDEIRGTIHRGATATAKYFAQNIMDMLSSELADANLQLSDSSRAIERVTSNIKEDGCQTCKLPMEGEDAFIVRCCGLIVCGVCCVKCNQIKVQYSYKHKKMMPIGKCANCKADIDPTSDLIFINRDFNLQNLLTAKGDETTPIIEEVAAPEPVAEATATEQSPEDKIRNPKLAAIYKILHGIKMAEQRRVDYKPKGLMEGKVNDPRPEGTPCKMVIFAGFNETLGLIEKMFIENNIEYLRLCGTAQDRDDTVRKFNTYGRVMLINSTENCGGLNLQMARDLVLFHAVDDKNIEAQAMARIMRIGGKYNARVHMLRYTNEALV
jgi:Helicase conserved C-terminal domain